MEFLREKTQNHFWNEYIIHLIKYELSRTLNLCFTKKHFFLLLQIHSNHNTWLGFVCLCVCVWSWINHDLSEEIKEILLVGFFSPFCLAFVFFDFLRHITNAFTHQLNPRLFILYSMCLSFCWLAAPNITNNKNANNIKNDFCANRNNNNIEKVINFVWKRIKSEYLVCVWMCAWVQIVCEWRVIYALTNRLKCKTSHFNI